MSAITTPTGIQLVRATVIASGMKLYLETGMKANTAYTPKAMMEAAGGIVGKTYKRNQLQQAHDDLRAWIEQQKAARTA